MRAQEIFLSLEPGRKSDVATSQTAGTGSGSWTGGISAICFGFPSPSASEFRGEAMETGGHGLQIIGKCIPEVAANTSESLFRHLRCLASPLLAQRKRHFDHSCPLESCRSVLSFAGELAQIFLDE